MHTPPNLIKCPACSTLCRPGSLCATCAQPRLPLTISSLPVASVPVHQQQLQELEHQHRQQFPLGKPKHILAAGAGGVAAEQLPVHIGPFLLSELIIDACRYNAGRATAYAAGFAEDLARVWPRLPPEAQLQIEQDLSRLFRKDDEARERRQLQHLMPLANLADAPLPLGMDCDRAAWEKVRQAWQATGAG
jgi:hypothetical protein